MKTSLLPALLAGAIVLSGCLGIGDEREEACGKLHTPICPLDDEEARLAARGVEARWRSEIEMRAREAPAERFPSPSRAQLLRRLRLAAARYEFRIHSVQTLRPAQLAPLVVVETDSPSRLVEDADEVLTLIDPKRPTGDDRTGWSYEAFFFEARDEDGVPFMISSNFWRGGDGGGGQWARAEEFFPFEHT